MHIVPAVSLRFRTGASSPSYVSPLPLLGQGGSLQPGGGGGKGGVLYRDFSVLGNSVRGIFRTHPKKSRGNSHLLKPEKRDPGIAIP